MLNRWTLLCCLPAVAGLPVSAAEAADVPGSAATRARLAVTSEVTTGSFEVRGDSDWYRVSLEGGQDYYIHCYAEGPLTCRLRDQAGGVLRSSGGGAESSGGFEFRVTRSGNYFVEYRDSTQSSGQVYPHAYDARVSPDCRANRQTQCRLRPGVTQQRLLASALDVDWFAAPLERGRTYTVRVEAGSEYSLKILDARGNTVATGVEESDEVEAITRFAPPARGPYFVVVAEDDDDGQQYRVTLTTP